MPDFELELKKENKMCPHAIGFGKMKNKFMQICGPINVANLLFR